MEKQFIVKNLEIDEIDGNKCVKFILSVDNKECELLEWLNKDNTIETIDSHIKINQMNDLEELFECSSRYIPFYEIIEQAQEITNVIL